MTWSIQPERWLKRQTHYQIKAPKKFMPVASHPVLSGPAIERIKNSELQTVVVCDTIPLTSDALDCNKFKVLTISKLIGEAIIRSHRGDSVTSLFV